MPSGEVEKVVADPRIAFGLCSSSSFIFLFAGISIESAAKITAPAEVLPISVA